MIEINNIFLYCLIIQVNDSRQRSSPPNEMTIYLHLV